MSGYFSTAVLSEDFRYRYSLSRGWDANKSGLLVVMLNPSTADASVDDPTIRRVVGFAKANGYGEVCVMNLYALRATNPAELKQEDAVGSENDARLSAVLRWNRDLCKPVLAAWGATKWAKVRSPEVAAMAPGLKWQCLGVTKAGSPRHPLYVPASQAFVSFQPDAQT